MPTAARTTYGVLMLSPFWAEYARVQSLVEQGKAYDEQLDFILKNKPCDDKCFDLHNSRRQLKNLSRNLERKKRSQKNLLERNCDCVGPKPFETPDVTAVRHEQATFLRQAAGEYWPLLRDTLDGDYESKSAEIRIPVGTIKSRVSRARARLRLIMSPGE
jgi:hypothetical protein